MCHCIVIQAKLKADLGQFNSIFYLETIMKEAVFILLGLVVGGGGVYFFVASKLQHQLASAERKLDRANRAVEDSDTLREQQTAQTEELREAQSRLRELEASYHAQIHDLEARHARELAQLTTNEPQVASLQEQLQSLQAQLESLKVEHEQEKRDLENQHQEQLKHLEANYQQQLAQKPQAELEVEETQNPPQPPETPLNALGGVLGGIAGVAGAVGLAGVAANFFGDRQEPEFTPSTVIEVEENIEPVVETEANWVDENPPMVTELPLEEHQPEAEENWVDQELEQEIPETMAPDLVAPQWETEMPSGEDFESPFGQGMPESETETLAVGEPEESLDPFAIVEASENWVDAPDLASLDTEAEFPLDAFLETPVAPDLVAEELGELGEGQIPDFSMPQREEEAIVEELEAATFTMPELEVPPEPAALTLELQSAEISELGEEDLLAVMEGEQQSTLTDSELSELEELGGTTDELDLPADFLADMPSYHPELGTETEEILSTSETDFLLELQEPEETAASDFNEDLMLELGDESLAGDLPLMDLFPAESEETLSMPEMPISNPSDSAEPFINLLDVSTDTPDPELLEMLQGHHSNLEQEEELFGDLGDFFSDTRESESSFNLEAEPDMPFLSSEALSPAESDDLDALLSEEPFSLDWETPSEPNP